MGIISITITRTPMTTTTTSWGMHHVLGFTGTRRGPTIPQLRQLETMLYAVRPAYLWHGGAEGADTEVELICKRLAIGCTSIRPTPTCSPLQRNRLIVERCDVLLACPRLHREEQRSGTWATIRYARMLHRPILIIWPTGTTTLESLPSHGATP